MITVSTTWNFDRLGTLGKAVREIAQLGFGAVELRAKGAVPDLVQGARACREVRIRCPSVHAPLTPGPWSNGDPSRDLASTNEARRGRAVAAVLGSLPAAAEAGARIVVVHLGEVSIEGASDRQRRWRQALAREGAFPADEVQAALLERRAQRDRYLDAAARSLFDLTRAEPGVTFALESRDGYHEIPDVEEVELLLSDSVGRRVAYWHDTGHAHVKGRLGIANELAWLDRYGARTAGIHFHDVVGDLDHLPPGAGEVDWAGLLPYVGTGMVRTLEVNSRHSAAELKSGAEFLEGRL